MEGLVWPILLFTGIGLVIAIRLGAVSAIRRWWGALRIRRMLQLELPPSHYSILHNVRLATPDRPIQIDHLVVSAYGIFVIRHRAISGRVAGKPGDSRWLWSRRRRQEYFPNPLIECVAQVKALRDLLGLDPSLFNFVVVFSGEVSFTNPLPVNVTRLDGLSLFIEGKDQLRIGFDDIRTLVGQVKAARPRGGLLRSPLHPAS